MTECPICKGEVPKAINRNGIRIFCSDRCKERNYYLKYKSRIIKRNNGWNLRNPEKRKQYSSKAMKNFLTHKRNRFNELMRKNYHRHKCKQSCRMKSQKIFNTLRINKQCSYCDSKLHIQIHHDVYPKSTNKIKQAITNHRIYYLCKKCHSLYHSLYHSTVNRKV